MELFTVVYVYTVSVCRQVLTGRVQSLTRTGPHVETFFRGSGPLRRYLVIIVDQVENVNSLRFVVLEGDQSVRLSVELVRDGHSMYQRSSFLPSYPLAIGNSNHFSVHATEVVRGRTRITTFTLRYRQPRATVTTVQDMVKQTSAP